MTFSPSFPDLHAENVIKTLKGQQIDRWASIESYYHLLGWCLGQEHGKQAVPAIAAQNDYTSELEALYSKIKANRATREYGLKESAGASTEQPKTEETKTEQPKPKLIQAEVPSGLSVFLMNKLNKLLTT